MKFFPRTLFAITDAVAAALTLVVTLRAAAPATTETGTDSALITLTATATTAISGTAPTISAPELSAQILARTFAPPRGLDREAGTFAALLEQFHYNRNAVKQAAYGNVVSDFMSAATPESILDFQHIFFLDSDKDAFTQRYTARWIYNNLTSLGKTDPAYEMFAVYQKRVVDRVNWVIDRLNTITLADLDGDDTYLYDRKDAPYPANAAASDSLWEQRLKNELINELLNKKNSDDKATEKALDEAKTTIRKRYERFLKDISEYEAKDIASIYLDTVARLYDPHTDYWSADYMDDTFNVMMTLQLIGIGATLRAEDDYCTIQEIVVGSPADLSKQLAPKDKIIAVAQDGEEPVDVVGMKLNKIVQLIRGKKGTKVHLTIIPAANPGERKEVTITRDIINLDSQRPRAAIYDVPNPDGHGTTPIGVITIPSGFTSADKNDKGEAVNSTTQDVSTLLDKLQAAPGGIEGLVLDLRGNGGGLLTEAINLAGLFVKAGPIVQVKDSSGQVEVMRSSAPAPKYTGPLAVLVDRLSASASEIVTGALQKYGRALIIGDSSTYGKGSVQAVAPIKQFAPALSLLNPRTGTIHFTTAKYYLPDGDSTQLKGVPSDIVLPNINDLFPIYEKDSPHALAWDEIPSSKFDARPIAPDIIATLRAASEKRQHTLDEFAYLQKNLDRYAAQYKDKTTPLNLDKRREQKADDKAFAKTQSLELDRLAKAVAYKTQEFYVVPEKPKNRTAATDKENKKNAELRQSGTASTDNDLKQQPDNTNQNDKTAIAPATTDEATATSTDEDDGSGLTIEQRDEDAKKLDINLREAMRVLLDKINMTRPATMQPAPATPTTPSFTPAAPETK